MTHDRLVRIARNWLGGSQYCFVVSTEHPAPIAEIPDAIGWRTQRNRDATESVLVECKANRGDFFADQMKWHRRLTNGLGDLRWFLTPPHLVDKSEVPDGWGLIEARRHGTSVACRKIVDAPRRETTLERALLERRYLAFIARNALQAVSLVAHFGVDATDARRKRAGEESTP